MTLFFSSAQDYPKLSQSYYSLLEVLTQDHMNFIASLEPHVIMYILSSISEGLTALGKRPGCVVCAIIRPYIVVSTRGNQAPGHEKMGTWEASHQSVQSVKPGQQVHGVREQQAPAFIGKGKPGGLAGLCRRVIEE
jgi:hypothetical protein